jgi:hypothetical protein
MGSLYLSTQKMYTNCEIEKDKGNLAMTGKMPTFDRLMNPLVQALKALGGSGSIEEIYDKVVELERLAAAPRQRHPMAYPNLEREFNSKTL